MKKIIVIIISIGFFLTACTMFNTGIRPFIKPTETPIEYVTATLVGTELTFTEATDGTNNKLYDAMLAANLDYNNFETITKIVFDTNGKKIVPENDLSVMFSDWYDLEEIIGIEFLDTSNVITMASMFQNCESLRKIDLSTFDTSKVENMYSMFYGCESLEELNISNWNTKNVTNMYDLFNGCSKIKTLDLSHFNTENVTNMESIFQDCEKLNKLNISNWNTTNVVDNVNMFYQCSALNSSNIITIDAIINEDIQDQINAL